MEIQTINTVYEDSYTAPFQENQLPCSTFCKSCSLFPKSYLIFHLILCLVGPISSQGWDGVIVTEANYQALQAFKHELVDPKGFLYSWNDTGYGACSGGWEGIKCAKGQVIVIQLPWKGLGGRITSKIGQLQALRKLSLHDNVISGLIPTSLGFLPNLRGVQLFNNRFSGSIPPSLGLCPLLQTLDFSNNSLFGSIPPSIVNSTKLFRLDLSYNQLSGEIPAGVTQSPSLVFLSLQYNNLSGYLPSSFNKLSLLQDVNVSHNQLSGVIPDEIGNLSEVVNLDFSDNFIIGTLPISLSNLQKLSVLNLSGNNLTGEIPASLGELQNLDSFNVSYNNLSGPVPITLSQKFNSSAFMGNLHLCGYNASTPCAISPSQPPPPAPSPRKRGRKLSTKNILLILAGVLLIILLLICFILSFCLIRKRKMEKEVKERRARSQKGILPSGGEVEASEETGGKLVHFDGSMAFNADDLLCASAEILGKSTYGTVYRATMEDGIQVAVRRLRERITTEEREFETEVHVLGRIRHPNLLAMRACYLGPKGEKLLVFDYMPKGSLATSLHARADNTRIDWPTRMKIAKGMTRGLLYLHNNLNIIHGNLTSSNVLLDEYSNAKVADYGLHRLMMDATNANVIATAGALGYRAPELSNIRRASTKTDVYSLGVIMLELLTGKPPGEAMNGVDLPRWVASTVKEEWTNEVFDLELVRDDGLSVNGDELLNTLKVAMHCVDPEASARPETYQILHQLEEIRPEIVSSSGDESGTAAASPS